MGAEAPEARWHGVMACRERRDTSAVPSFLPSWKFEVPWALSRLATGLLEPAAPRRCPTQSVGVARHERTSGQRTKLLHGAAARHAERWRDEPQFRLGVSDGAKGFRKTGIQTGTFSFKSVSCCAFVSAAVRSSVAHAQ